MSVRVWRERWGWERECVSVRRKIVVFVRGKERERVPQCTQVDEQREVEGDRNEDKVDDLA